MGASIVRVNELQRHPNRSDSSDFQFFLPDALGTVRDVVDDSGAVIRSMEFAEHGQLISSSGSGTFSPKTYQGALSVNDDRNDSGLYLMGHRHFAPSLGRFISRDPIGFRGGLNLFNGAGASPTTMVDPAGLQYGDYVPIGPPSEFTIDQYILLDGAIDTIDNLGYYEEAHILRQQLNSGSLYNSKYNPFNVGFNDPFFKSIGIDMNYCQVDQKSGLERSKFEQQAYIAALLFHEATHHRKQSRSTLLSLGFNAYINGDKVAERDLEMPIYAAERDFLTKWKQSGPSSGDLAKAIQARIDAAQLQVKNLNMEASAYCKRPRPDSRK